MVGEIALNSGIVVIAVVAYLAYRFGRSEPSQEARTRVIEEDRRQTEQMLAYQERRAEREGAELEARRLEIERRRALNGQARRDGFADGVLGTHEREKRNEFPGARRDYRSGIAGARRLSEEERLVLRERASGMVPGAIADRHGLTDARVRAVLRRLKDLGAVE